MNSEEIENNAVLETAENIKVGQPTEAPAIAENATESPAETNVLAKTERAGEKSADGTGSVGGLTGKFASIGDLCRAYENLQSEFTRKCQELSKLKQDGTNREEIIREYLTSVAACPKAPAVITGDSAFAFGVKPAARSLRDTEKIAEQYFRTKEINT